MIVLEANAPLKEKSPVSFVRSPINFRKYFQQRKRFLLWKRGIDIIFSSLIIIFVLSWLLPIIAILIKLSSKGPVFFIQKRVGFLGKSFSCIKFRTMVLNEDANTKQAVENDPRITKLGRFLRLSNIDELPQFFNVLVGEMSIVGPRPHMHIDCNDFSKVITNYKFRSISKPGITGLAQVKGCRGPVKDEESIFRRFQWDSFYVRNQDYKLDTRIIGLTIICTLKSLYSVTFPGKKKHEKKEMLINYQLNAGEYLN
jgi:putative colanic acid biosysnthesis UDP-glucose lipid carrier transferase